MEGRHGVPRRRAAAVGSPACGPPGDPQEQQREEVGEGEGGWEGAPYEDGGGGDGMGISVYDDDKDVVVENPGARVPGRATADGRPPGRNTCCICLQPWTAGGAHRVCCIPCGHVYGRCCLFRWLIQCRRATAKCPHCGEQYNYDSIINLYTTEHLWDDCHQEQASRQGVVEEEPLEEVESVLEEIVRRDELIAQMEEKIALRDELIARMEEKIAWRDELIARRDELIARMKMRIARMTHALRVTLVKVCDIEKSIARWSMVNIMIRVAIAVLLLSVICKMLITDLW